MMYRAVVREIEVAGRQRFACALRADFGLEGIEFFRFA